MKKTKKPRAYCISPSCPMIAEEGSDKCAICNGNVERDENGFVIWKSKRQLVNKGGEKR